MTVTRLGRNRAVDKSSTSGSGLLSCTARTTWRGGRDGFGAGRGCGGSGDTAGAGCGAGAGLAIGRERCSGATVVNRRGRATDADGPLGRSCLGRTEASFTLMMVKLMLS